jgi:hypothetical protein
MAEKIIILKILRATQIIVRASSDDSHFLPFANNWKHDSGGRARQLFFRRSIACLPLKKLWIVALYLLCASRNLPLRSTGVSFSRIENH